MGGKPGTAFGCTPGVVGGAPVVLEEGSVEELPPPAALGARIKSTLLVHEKKDFHTIVGLKSIS